MAISRDIELKPKIDKRFGWTALYSDGTRIEQFPAGHEETNFGVVRAKGRPAMFYVGQKYGIDLEMGEFLIDGQLLPLGDINAMPLVPLELTYFRRNEVQVNTRGETISHRVWHFVGYKHECGEVRLCLPDDGGPATLCIGGRQ